MASVRRAAQAVLRSVSPAYRDQHGDLRHQTTPPMGSGTVFEPVRQRIIVPNRRT